MSRHGFPEVERRGWAEGHMSRYGWIPGGRKGNEQKGACLGMGSGGGGEECISRHGFLEG